MSIQAFLVSMKKKEIMNLGKIIRDENNNFVKFSLPGVSEEVIKDAINRFLLDHAKDDTRLLTSIEYDDLDRTGFIRVTEDYGIPFKGPRKIYFDKEMQSESADEKNSD